MLFRFDQANKKKSVIYTLSSSKFKKLKQVLKVAHYVICFIIVIHDQILVEKKY